MGLDGAQGARRGSKIFKFKGPYCGKTLKGLRVGIKGRK